MLVYVGLRRCCRCTSRWACCRPRPARCSPRASAPAVVAVLGLHLAAALQGARRRPAARRRGRRERPKGLRRRVRRRDIPEKRARVVCLAASGWRSSATTAQVSAVSNVCRHQNGPLGEGRDRRRLRHLPLARLPVPARAPAPRRRRSPRRCRPSACAWRRARVGRTRGPIRRDPGRPAGRAGAGRSGGRRGGAAEPSSTSATCRGSRRDRSRGPRAARSLAVLAGGRSPRSWPPRSSRSRAAVFEYGVVRDFAGRRRGGPDADARGCERPGEAPGGSAEAHSRSGYAGRRRQARRAGARAPGSTAARVRLRGTLVYRGGQTMLEVVPGRSSPRGPATPADGRTAGEPELRASARHPRRPRSSTASATSA